MGLCAQAASLEKISGYFKDIEHWFNYIILNLSLLRHAKPQTGIRDKRQIVSKTPGLAIHVSGVDNRAYGYIFATFLGVRKIEIKDARRATGSRDVVAVYYGLLVQSHYGHGTPAVRQWL